MRLIDADALKYELGDTCDGEPIFRSTEFVRMDVIKKAIDEAPTIERPQEENIYSTCPKCGSIILFNLCPNCGTKLRGEQR